MEIIIHQAILHVLDTTMDAPVLSGSGMEMTAEKTAYFQYHIEKLLASDDIRQCRPLPDSAFKNELEHNHDFVDLSCRIAGVLFDYMHAHTTIPGADLAVVDFTRDGEPWLGILKLNYKNGYTHYTETVEGAPVNSIIQQRACLPTQSGKVEEGALVDLTDYSMRLLEKKYDIDGHKEFYDPSHVLLAIGLPHEIAHGSLRLSFSDGNTMEDADYILECLPPIIDRLRAMSPLWERIKKQEKESK